MNDPAIMAAIIAGIAAVLAALIGFFGIIFGAGVTALITYIQNKQTAQLEREKFILEQESQHKQWVRDRRAQHIATIRRTLGFITVITTIGVHKEEAEAFFLKQRVDLAERLEGIYTAQSHLGDEDLLQLIEELLTFNYLQERERFGKLRDKIYKRLEELEANS